MNLNVEKHGVEIQELQKNTMVEEPKLNSLFFFLKWQIQKISHQHVRFEIAFEKSVRKFGSYVFAKICFALLGNLPSFQTATVKFVSFFALEFCSDRTSRAAGADVSAPGRAEKGEQF